MFHYLLPHSLTHTFHQQDWVQAQLTPLLDHPIQTILDNMALPQGAAAAAGDSSGGGSAAAAAGVAGRQQAAAAAVDWGAVGLAHVNAVAGACFAVGLRFAGAHTGPAVDGDVPCCTATLSLCDRMWRLVDPVLMPLC